VDGFLIVVSREVWLFRDIYGSTVRNRPMRNDKHAVVNGVINDVEHCTHVPGADVKISAVTTGTVISVDAVHTHGAAINGEAIAPLVGHGAASLKGLLCHLLGDRVWDHNLDDRTFSAALSTSTLEHFEVYLTH